MKHILMTAAAALTLSSMTLSATSGPDYRKKTLPVEDRVEDLMSRMTLEEKVGQMCQYLPPEHIRKTNRQFKGKVSANDDTNGTYPTVTIDSMLTMVRKGLIGSFLHVVTAEESNALQKEAMKSRLGIPLIIGIDAIHGAGYSVGTTIYPTAITQASSFNPGLVELCSAQASEEIRAMGSSWAFTPNVDVCRDPRWGRVGETFGEDPYLISRMGIAMVKGLQGNDPEKYGVAACVKHLVAGGKPVNGLNAASMEVSSYTLEDLYLYPFRKTVEEASPATMMVAHNEINGIPCHANGALVNGKVRNGYGFDGFFVSDWDDIHRVHTLHRYSDSKKDTYLEAVNAGLDMHMHGPGFFEGVLELLEEGKLSMEQIDSACARILEVKFRLGLFENPYTDIKESSKSVFSKEHQEAALALAEESIVLLKNNGILPLAAGKTGKILVTGPNADSHAILGDWVMKQPEENVTTLLEGLQSVFGKENILFHDVSTNVRFHNPEAVEEAFRKAKECDLAIIAVGENPLRYEDRRLVTSGENFDRMNIDLLGDQELLVRRVKEAGIPVIAVLVGGRPLSVNWIAEHADAVIQAWEPGSFGGLAISNIISGKVNPSGKLPVTIPRSAGQIQMVYNGKRSDSFRTYRDGASTPLYPFGFGLSYTSFRFSDIRISAPEIQKDGTAEVSVTVTNTGKTAGQEVIQLYIKDCFAKPTRPVKELKDFKKLKLEPGEKKVVKFVVNPEKLSFTNLDGEWKVQEGDFEIYIGNSSADRNLLKTNLRVD